MAVVRQEGPGDLRAARLPDTIARLVTFTVTATTRSGRTKTTRMRVLTTLLDHEAHPAWYGSRTWRCELGEGPGLADVILYGMYGCEHSRPVIMPV